ncbi:MAG TPA: PP2C family serine/threonine-protein phosphatase [Vicinamibacteria bacterium]|nr:PP2C family serine/threonine-protein phosphatase [Vicinamibacteria bacterium]
MTVGQREAESERTGALEGPGLVAAARSDRGPRERNEDTYVCRPDLGLFAVIDGMGGHKAGAEAAALAREAFLGERDLLHAFLNANDRIHRASQKRNQNKGMGCVASAVRIVGDKACVAHVGDTRVYLASEGALEQLTRDHTVAAHAQEQLGIPESGAKQIGGQNQVTRDLGGHPRTGDDWIDNCEVTLEEGDLLVLCSDGVHGVVESSGFFARLREARRQGAAPETLVEELVELALACGTRDNSTVVVVRYVAPARKVSIWKKDILAWMKRKPA